ncbi:MAG: SUMF1/EgtB/PvdO family nonheme iron enzyme [Acidobacteriota bacterium]
MLGRTIGNYEVISQFGEGGMGELYLGRHTRLAREVVIKTIRTEDFNPRQIEHLRERLEREALIQSQLDHPNIVRVYDFIAVGEKTCIVMEHVPGRDLRKMILHETGPIPARRAIHLFKQILEAINYAHNFNYVDKSGERHRGIIHRDLKPANILVTPEDLVKVTDFGIVKMRGVKGGTQMGFNPGTPEYMSPEQARGKDLDHRSDIYSLGIVLYEMLTGRVPFDADGSGTSDYEIRRGHIELPVPRLSKFLPCIPQALELIVFKALEKDPDHRFQTASQFLDTIIQFESTGVVEVSHPTGPRKTVLQPPPPPPVAEDSGRGGSDADTVISAPEGGATGKLEPPSRPEPSPVPPTAPLPPSAGQRQPGRPLLLIALGLVLVAAFGASWWILKQAPASALPEEAAPNAVSVPPGMISIPGGEFQMGRDDGNVYERPAHKVQVKPFYIDHYEVTNDEYAKFVRLTRRNPPAHWREGQYENGEARLPVVNVTWYEARAFCEWAGKRLPVESEWEYAARGRDNRLYPYGNEWKPRFSNARETGLDKPQAVGSYPEGDSTFGVADLAGNVAEWTETEYLPYPGSQARRDDGHRIIRGGGFRVPAREQTATERFFDRPSASYDFVGFRCAKDQAESGAGGAAQGKN